MTMLEGGRGDTAVAFGRELDDRDGLGLRRARLYARLQERPVPGISAQEITAHFQGMPGHYWERVTKAELSWALETVHCFLKSTQPAPAVVAQSRHCPERGVTKVMVCAWDRPGLLAKIAAAFGALRINILRADVYTRGDNLALDLFEVTDIETGREVNGDRVNHLVFLLEGALSEPPRFVSIWTAQLHKMLAKKSGLPPHIEFENGAGYQTMIRVEAADRFGLLHDLLQALSACQLDIAQALVKTEDGKATDVFYVTDAKRRKVLEAGQLEHIRKTLAAAVTGSGTST